MRAYISLNWTNFSQLIISHDGLILPEEGYELSSSFPIDFKFY